MKMQAIIAAMAIVLASWTTSVGAEHYRVVIDLLHSNKVTASPTLIVKDGRPASVSVSGDDGYEVALTVRKQNTEFLVDTQINTAAGFIDPSFLVQATHPAEVSIGEIGLRLTVTEQP